MKKMTLALAAVSLLALPVFAAPAPKVGTGSKPKVSPKAPSTGGKIGSAPVAGSKSTPVIGGTKAAPALGVGSTSVAPKAPGAGAARAGSICPANSVVAKLSAQEKAIMAQAEQTGVGGNDCASTLKSVATAQTLAAINAAGIRQLKAEGCADVASCSLESNARVLDAKAAALAIRNGNTQAEALKGLIQADTQACDFNGKLNNGAIHTAALSN